MTPSEILGTGANVAQILSVIVPAIIYKMLQCHVPWCWRHGKIKVPGTHYKVCPKHNTKRHHEWMFARHRRLHPDWNE